jgi:hypothetical protein
MLGQRVHSDDRPFGPDTPAAKDFISAIGPYTLTDVAVASRPSPKSDQPKGDLIFCSTSRRSESIASPSREKLSQAARKAGLRAAPLAGIDGATLVHFSLGFSVGFAVAVGPSY